MSCDRCQKLELALRALFTFMQADRGDKVRRNVDEVIGLVHDVMPEMVEEDHKRRTATYRAKILDGRGSR